MVFYNMQIGPLFMATIIAFLIAACVLLLKMTSIFGIQDIQEKKIIRTTIVIYIVVFAVRIISLVLIVSDKQTFIKVYTEKYLEF
jgi:hypothetical protein